MHLVILFLSSVAVAISPLQDANLSTVDYSTLVVIPDIHGDYSAAKRSLYLGYKAVSPVDGNVSFEEFSARFDRYVLLGEPGERLSNSSEGIALVQLGDVIDRGPLSAECIELLAAIPSILGWKTVNLYGNHDVVAMTDVWPLMVHPEEIAEFGSLKSRTDAFHNNGIFFARYIDSYLGMARWRSPNVRDKDRDPNTLFVHAGVSMDWFNNWVVKYVFSDTFGSRESLTSDEALNKFNAELRAFLNDPGKMKTILNYEDSFLWHRYEDNEKTCLMVRKALKYFGVARIVVGHTPRLDRRVTAICDNRLILADVGMSAWIGLGPSNPVALVLRADDHGDLGSTTVHYEDEPDVEIMAPKRLVVSMFEKISDWYRSVYNKVFDK